jgi:hypothetical protein
MQAYDYRRAYAASHLCSAACSVIPGSLPANAHSFPYAPSTMSRFVIAQSAMQNAADRAGNPLVEESERHLLTDSCANAGRILCKSEHFFQKERCFLSAKSLFVELRIAVGAPQIALSH